MKKVVVVLLCMAVLMISITACVKDGEKKAGNKTGNAVSSSSAPQGSIQNILILDKTLLRNGEGIPIAVKVVADVQAPASSCTLKYGRKSVENVQTSSASSLPQQGKIMLVAPLLGRVELQRWEVCCGEVCKT